MEKVRCIRCGKLRGARSIRPNGMCGYCDLNVNGIDKTCVECEGTFHTHSNRQTMCDDCKREAKGIPESLTCPVCGYECSSVAGYKTHTRTHEDGYVRRTFSDETKRRMSESAKARTDRGPISESHRQAIIRSNRTRTVSEETKRRISESNKGKVMSDEAKARMSEVQRRRFESDPTLRMKMGEYSRMSGRKGSHMSEESKRRLSEAQKRRFREHPELRTKLSEMASARSTEKLKATKRKGWTEDACRFCDDESFAWSILDSFDHNPSMYELQERLGTWNQRVGKAVIRYGMSDRIHRTSPHSPSNEEAELFQFVRSIAPDARQTVRDIIKPQELDVYVPSRNLAIEFDGSYWHTDEFKDSGYHLGKTEACEALGIRLIHVFEWEWTNNKKVVKSLLSTALGVSERVGARKCDVVEVDSHTAMEFLRENHIQGAIGSRYRLGLSHDGELVALMTFGKPRFSGFDGVEMLRYCCRMGTEVVGGMSRLLKHSMERFGITDVISYCNRSKFTGSSYERIGFAHTRDTAPSYWWIHNNPFDMLSRYSTQMKDEDATMRERGYSRFYDCGTKVYELHG